LTKDRGGGKGSKKASSRSGFRRGMTKPCWVTKNAKAGEAKKDRLYQRPAAGEILFLVGGKELRAQHNNGFTDRSPRQNQISLFFPVARPSEHPATLSNHTGVKKKKGCDREKKSQKQSARETCFLKYTERRGIVKPLGVAVERGQQEESEKKEGVHQSLCENYLRRGR